jgi:hypothetical protein
MTEQSQPITIAHPPDAVLRVVNPVLKGLLNTPLMGPARRQFMIVSFTGRKTGRHLSVVVSAHQIDDALYSLTGANAKWRYNFRDGAQAQVLFNGKTASMHGELIDDVGLLADLYTRLTQSYGAKRAGRSMGLAFRNNEAPTRDQFAAAVQELRLRGIRFTPAP